MGTLPSILGLWTVAESEDSDSPSLFEQALINRHFNEMLQALLNITDFDFEVLQDTSLISWQNIS